MRIIFILVIISGAFMTPSLSNAKDLRITNTIYLENGKIVEPKILLKTKDDGFIIAGNSAQKAFATKIDSAGNVKWRYEAPARTELLSEESRQYTASELTYTYVSGTIMQDGSVFLFGYIPYLKKGSGFVTHLDQNGNLLNDQALLHPQNNEKIGGKFISCTALNDGVLVVGQTLIETLVTPDASNPHRYKEDYFYWIMFFDINGKMVWEKLEPISRKMAGFPDSISPLQIINDGGVIFVGQRGGLNASEIVHIKANGSIAKNILNGEFRLVLPVNSATDIQLVSMQTAALTKIALNNDLQETSRQLENYQKAYVNMAYRKPDQTLLLFGHLTSGHQYDAAVIKIDKSMKNETVLNLSPNKESNWVAAALPVGELGEFISARSAIRPLKLGQAPTEENFKASRIGMALDFITSE